MKTFFSAIFHWVDAEENFSLWKYFQKMIIFSFFLIWSHLFIEWMSQFFMDIFWSAQSIEDRNQIFQILGIIFHDGILVILLIFLYNLIHYFFLSLKNSTQIFEKIFIIIFSLIPVYFLYKTILYIFSS